MKNFINTLWSVLESFAEARAAASLARMGDLAGAKAVYK